MACEGYPSELQRDFVALCAPLTHVRDIAEDIGGVHLAKAVNQSCKAAGSNVKSDQPRRWRA